MKTRSRAVAFIHVCDSISFKRYECYQGGPNFNLGYGTTKTGYGTTSVGCRVGVGMLRGAGNSLT